MPKLKVFIPQPIADRAVNLLIESGDFEVIMPRSSESVPLEDILGTADALIVRSGFKVSKKIIDLAPNLKIISRVGAGVDNIDVEYAERKGIKVVNVRGGNAQSVAEHAIALMLCIAKGIIWYDKQTRIGNWEARNSYRAQELHGKTLGVIGLGAIGRRVAEFARPIGMSVIAYDPFVDETQIPDFVERVFALKDLLVKSDFVSIHVPLTEATRNMIGKEELEIMKPTSFLINLSRGSVVDEEALYKALVEGKIAGAALDVFEKEPPDCNNPIFSLENVVVTPHMAGLTKESSERVAILAVKNVIEFFKNNFKK